MRSSSSIGSCASLTESIGEWTSADIADDDVDNECDGLQLRTRLQSFGERSNSPLPRSHLLSVGERSNSPLLNDQPHQNGSVWIWHLKSISRNHLLFLLLLIICRQNSDSVPRRRPRLFSEAGSGTITDEADRAAFMYL